MGAEHFTEGRPARLAVPVADLLARPGGARDRQVLFGAPLLVLEEAEGLAFVQSLRDGYVGYLPIATLTTAAAATHWVAGPATHVYSRADLKSAEIMGLSFCSQLTLTGQGGAVPRPRHRGFVPVQHLREIGALFTDPVLVAARFICTPYLWGGNSRQGIDCCGLVQMACHACGFDCPGDRDMQAAGFGCLLGAAALSGLNLSPASRAGSSRAAAPRLPSGACPRAGPASPPPRPRHRRW